MRLVMLAGGKAAGKSSKPEAKKARLANQAGFSVSGGYALIRTGDPIIMSDVL